MFGATVTGIDAHAGSTSKISFEHVKSYGSHARTKMWAAGVAASPIGKMLADAERAPRPTAPDECWCAPI